MIITKVLSLLFELCYNLMFWIMITKTLKFTNFVSLPNYFITVNSIFINVLLVNIEQWKANNRNDNNFSCDI